VKTEWGNQKLTIQRHWQYWAQVTEKKTKNTT